MISPLEIARLAVRIRRLGYTDTHGWHPGDEMEFQQSLPTGRSPKKLPDPDLLRNTTVSMGDYRLWLQTAQRLEGLISDNDPRNPKRVIRDMVRGKLPFRTR